MNKKITAAEEKKIKILIFCPSEIILSGILKAMEADAGSPEKSEQYYPIKAIYEVDNTCWVAVGFKPTGEEPHLCPSTAPPATRKPKPIPTPPTPVIG